jgi:hypothetical protein
MLHARVCDPAGPRWWRVATAVGAFPLVALVMLLPWALPAQAAFLLGFAWLTMGRIVVPRLRPREGCIALEKGAIRVKGAGLASQRVAARDVRAASTAQLPDGKCSVALVRHEHGDAPLWLELDSRDDLDRLRRALGIGYGGFGALRWPSRRGTFHNTPNAPDFLATLGWMGILAATCFNETVLTVMAAVAVVPLTLAAMVLAATARPLQHGVLLMPHGIEVLVDGRSAFLPWEAVANVTVDGTGLSIQTPSRTEVVAMPAALPAEREHIAAQIRSAAGRARGEGPLPPELPSSLAVLSPRDEGRRAWLERLDATAASMAQGEGYRQTSVAARDLWTALDSPDVPTNLRAAAARTLARVAPEEAGDRIEKALSMEHDEQTRACIRVVLEEDLDVAARELDRLDRA